MNWKGGFADLTGVTVGHFTVIDIAGRDRSKAPLWRVICKNPVCKREQIFSHATITSRLESRCAEETLFCKNPACVRSRPEPVHRETIADVRRAEREEREQAEAVAQRERERAAQQSAKDAALRAEKKLYLKFANSQIRAGV